MRNQLLKSFVQCCSFTGMSRILGLIRDIVCAHFLGASATFDAFLVAFQIPNFMRRLFAEGAMSQAFVPVLSECQADSSQRQLELMQRTLGMLLLGLCVLTVIVMLFAPWVIKLYAPGFANDPYRLQSATQLLYWTFPYLAFISVAAFFAAILNCKNKFVASSAAPILLNICLIMGAMWAGQNNHSAAGLGYAVPIAGILQMALLMWRSVKVSGIILPKYNFKDPQVRKIWRLMSLALFGVCVSQIGLIVDTLLASFLQHGSISWLYFSQRLVFLPLGLFGVAAATVILPKLSRKQGKCLETLSWAINLIIILSLPSVAGLVVLSQPILITLFKYGMFNITDVLQTQQSLVALTLGLPAFMLNKILIAQFYAQQKIQATVKIATKSLIANIILAIFFMQFLQHAGIALASALAAWCQLFLLARDLNLTSLLVWNKQLIIKSLFATLIMTLILLIISPNIATWLNFSLIYRVLCLLFMLLVGCISYAGLVKFFKLKSYVLS